MVVLTQNMEAKNRRDLDSNHLVFWGLYNGRVFFLYVGGV